MGPSDDELIPPESNETLAEHARSLNLDPNRENKKDGNQDGSCPNPNPPEREGGPLTEPGPLRRKLREDVDKKREDREFSDRHCIGIPDADTVVSIAAEDVAQAGKDRTRCWSEYPALFPMGQPTDILRNPSFMTEDSRPAGPEHGCVHEDPLRPWRER